MSEPFKFNLSVLGPVPRAVVLRYLTTRSVQSTAAAMQVDLDTVKRHLRRAGLGRRVQIALEGGAKYQVDDSEPTSAAAPAAPAVKAEPVRLDLVEKHRYETNEKVLKAQLTDLTKRLAAAEDHRNSILGLTFDPVEPIAAPRIRKPKDAASNRQAIVCQLSDLHVGETVFSKQMMGVNSYDREIARKRIGRYFEKASILSTSAWPASDGAPSVVFILLGGDLVSGHGLHPELAETDAGTWYEQSKWAAQYIAAGALRLHLELEARFKKPIPFEFISVPGNHGRSTFGKPRAKMASLHSYDTLVADFIESSLRQYPNMKHFQPEAFDAYFDIVGWPALLTHGDRMSAGGGTGFIGPAANIVKGHKKLMLTEAQQRRPVRFIFSHHFHTTLTTPWGFANGAAIGPSEFAKAIRADLEPAQQNFVVIGEKLGLIRYQPIVLGTPDEGSIYSPNGGLILPTQH